MAGLRDAERGEASPGSVGGGCDAAADGRSATRDSEVMTGAGRRYNTAVSSGVLGGGLDGGGRGAARAKGNGRRAGAGGGGGTWRGCGAALIGG
eukprot:565908-Amphidinium_carterae.4